MEVVFHEFRRQCLRGGELWGAGPSGMNNFNPGIFGTGFCKNPGIPGFSGSGLASISNPGIVLNFSGFFGISVFCVISGQFL